MNFGEYYTRVDHLAIAVLDLELAIDYYIDKFGYKLDTVRDTKGKHSGMRSAVLFSGEFSVVLMVSLTGGSQIEKYIRRFGPGVQHVAFAVENIRTAYDVLLSRGVSFSTTILEAEGLKQVFTTRDPNTGMMFEFIERTNQTNFDEKNINQLFEQLEKNNEF